MTPVMKCRAWALVLALVLPSCRQRAAAPISALAPGGGLAPLTHYHDLVAGDGRAGYRDGEFYRAEFHGPVGLAVAMDHRRLFVADRDSHRIRSIRLDASNRVETLAGTGEAGKQDGPLEAASFDRPAALAVVSSEALIVSDEGNALLRLVNLQNRQVTTLAGNGLRGFLDGEAREASLGGIWSLAYAEEEKALYFSQPDARTVRRLDMATRKITTVIKDDPRLPAPGALAIFDKHLWIADRIGQVYKMAVPRRDANPLSFILEEGGGGDHVVALAGSAGRLYALQCDPAPPWIALGPPAELPLLSVWGEPMEASTPSRPAYLSFSSGEPTGFVADAEREKAFYVSSSTLQRVLRVKDYRFAELQESRSPSGNGLTDFDYPERKPPGVFRILVAGDSHTFHFTEKDQVRWGFGYNRMQTLPKRLELMLNTAAAVTGSPAHYEVLTVGRVSWEPLAVWPSYEVPDLTRRFGADLILLMIPPDTATLQAYIDRPATTEGIPELKPDMEYMLRPYQEKIHHSPARKLLEICQTRGWLHVVSPTGIEVERLRVLAADPVTRAELLALFGRPIQKLKRALASVGKEASPQLVICFLPIAERDPYEIERGFWKELCDREGVAWMDLTDSFLTVQETYFPVSDSYHLTADGHELMALLLAERLRQEKRLVIGPARQ
jgi:hypothetical protein